MSKLKDKLLASVNKVAKPKSPAKEVGANKAKAKTKKVKSTTATINTKKQSKNKPVVAKKASVKSKNSGKKVSSSGFSPQRVWPD